MIAGTAPISHFRQLERCPRAIRKYLRIPKIIMCNGIAPFVQIIELDVPYSISSIHGVQVSPQRNAQSVKIVANIARPCISTPHG
jgi:hypothetical protein